MAQIRITLPSTGGGSSPSTPGVTEYLYENHFIRNTNELGSTTSAGGTVTQQDGSAYGIPHVVGTSRLQVPATYTAPGPGATTALPNTTQTPWQIQALSDFWIEFKCRFDFPNTTEGVRMIIGLAMFSGAPGVGESFYVQWNPTGVWTYPGATPPADPVAGRYGFIKATGGPLPASFSAVDTTIVYGANAWHVWRMLYNASGGSMDLYCDGILVATHTFAPSSLRYRFVAQVQRSNAGTTTNPCSLDIDYLRIYWNN